MSDNTADNTQAPVSESRLVTADGAPLTINGESIEDKLAEVRRKLGLNNDGEPMGEPEAEEDRPSIPSGSDVDWSEFDLLPQFAHLYPRAARLMTDDGPAWVVILDTYFALRAPYDILGHKIAQMVNGPDQWHLQSAIIPAGQITRRNAKLAGHPEVFGACGLVTLQRKIKIVLPEPKLLVKEEAEESAPPTSEELAKTEDAALAWVNSPEGQVSDVNTADSPVTTPASLEERAESQAAGEFQPSRTTLPEGALKAAADAADARNG